VRVSEPRWGEGAAISAGYTNLVDEGDRRVLAKRLDSTAPRTSRKMCCPTHCASYRAPCQPLLRAFQYLVDEGDGRVLAKLFVDGERVERRAHLRR